MIAIRDFFPSHVQVALWLSDVVWLGLKKTIGSRTWKSCSLAAGRVVEALGSGLWAYLFAWTPN